MSFFHFKVATRIGLVVKIELFSLKNGDEIEARRQKMEFFENGDENGSRRPKIELFPPQNGDEIRARRQN
ncbi:hypothetical protein CEJ87_14620 [Caldifermentibacillus hisashii]|nr:hypothetical protein CEJ87_14620 [Caldifermentibacillus hisashii]